MPFPQARLAAPPAFRKTSFVVMARSDAFHKSGEEFCEKISVRLRGEVPGFDVVAVDVEEVQVTEALLETLFIEEEKRLEVLSQRPVEDGLFRLAATIETSVPNRDKTPATREKSRDRSPRCRARASRRSTHTRAWAESATG